jgi:hypothetical protein
MRHRLLRVSTGLTAAGLLIGPAPAHAQLSLALRGGASFSSILVRDEINQEITLAPNPAPALSLAVASRLNAQWQVGASVEWSSSDLVRREAGQEFAILPLTIWTATFGLRRTLTSWAAIGGSFGGIKYAPGGDRDGTIFQDDAPFLPTAGLSAQVEKALGRRWGVGLELAYGFHRFTSQALRDAGLTGHRSVHRFTVGVVLRGNLTNATN